MIYIFIILIIVLYLSLTAYIKYKLKFWITQPVFHIYNIWYWIRPPGIILSDLPSIASIAQKGSSKYLNQYNIKTLKFAEIKEDVICDRLCNFIKSYYIASTKTAAYTPSKEDIINYHIGTNHPSFFSMYQQPQLLFEKGEPTTTITEIIGVISARPLNIRLKNTATFPTYYIDNLCVHPAYRKSGIAPQIIQTQCYNLRHANKNIKTCLFKREGQLNALVPLVVFDTFCFDLTIFYQTQKQKQINNINVIEIGIAQLPSFTAFIKSQMKNFDCVILPDLTNLMHLIKTGNIIIYALMDRTANIIATYMFRRLNMTYTNVGANVGATNVGATNVGATNVGATNVGATNVGANVGANVNKKQHAIECINIVIAKCVDTTCVDTTCVDTTCVDTTCVDTTCVDTTCVDTTCVVGFSISLLKLKEKNEIDLLLIEDTANARVVIDNLNNKLNLPIKFKSPTAFFLYNYACYSLYKSELALIIY
jgi:hypothetical protein